MTAALLVAGVQLEAAQLAPTPTPAPVTSPASGERGLSPGFGNVGSLSGPANAAVAQLRPRDNALRAEGEATLLRTGDSTTVTVNLTGLIPGAVYFGRVRAGGCEGPLLFTLESVSADAQGRGRASSLVPGPIDASNWWVAYAADGDQAAMAGTCGAVQPDL